MFWSACRMHPHHQGSTSLMMQSCSVPVVLDENPNEGFDYLATPSCERLRSIFTPDNEVIMHMQVACSPLTLPCTSDDTFGAPFERRVAACITILHVQCSYYMPRQADICVALWSCTQCDSSADVDNMPLAMLPVTEHD